MLIVLGLLILLPFQAWGVAFEVLVEIGVKAPREAAVAAGIGDFERELLPLAYQAGSLLFPVLVPVGAWAALGGLRPWMPEAFVKEKATLRSLIHSANRILAEAYHAEEDADLILDGAEKAIFEIAEDRIREGFTPLRDLVQSSFATIGANRGACRRPSAVINACDHSSPLPCIGE